MIGMDRPPAHKRRPLTVTLLLLVVLIIAVMNIIRIEASLRYWKTLSDIGVSPGPLYILLTGLFWSIAFLGLFVGLWLGHPRSRIAGLILVPLYLIYSWVDRMAFQNTVPRENTSFAVAVTFLVVFYTLFTLLLPANQHYFSRENEQ